MDAGRASIFWTRDTPGEAAEDPQADETERERESALLKFDRFSADYRNQRFKKKTRNSNFFARVPERKENRSKKKLFQLILNIFYASDKKL